MRKSASDTATATAAEPAERSEPVGMPSETDEPRSGIQVISRAAAVLRSLQHEQTGLSLGQIADKVGLPRSTVQRIVDALQAEHFVISATNGRGIRLGPGLTALAESARIDIVELLHPYLVELAEATNETIDLAILRNHSMIFLDQIPSRHRLRAVSSIGDAFPLTCTANGKACLAKLPDTDAVALFEQERGAATAQAMTAFMAELAEARRSGIAYDRDEHTDGISAMGASLVDLHGNIYAIAIPIPTSRFTRSEAKIRRALLSLMARIAVLPVFHITES